MSDKPLPRPVTATDHYLAAILGELKAQRPSVNNDGLVALREPSSPGSPLPDDFPGLDALAEAGIVYLETVPRDGDALVAIPGIGKATAGKILAALQKAR